ncbi:hypothetical protein D1P53_000828 [Cryptococcus gattii VGV]|nr:hypothetical protein D1P53_000828 [Cryptococcus gattii VGV]
MGIEEQVLGTPPPQAVIVDPILTPHSLCILPHLARITLLEKGLASTNAVLALERATQGSQKRQRYPEGQLFDLSYQEEHAEELAIRKAKEEEARRTCRWTAHVRHSRMESNMAHAWMLGPLGTS